jgi:hypothetical protein
VLNRRAFPLSQGENQLVDGWDGARYRDTAGGKSRRGMVMSLLKSVVMIPAVASALWVARSPQVKVQKASSEVSTEVSTDFSSAVKMDDVVSTVAGEDAAAKVPMRKLRLQNLLATLNNIAEVSMQMAPERSANLEPIIVDLAERTIELTGAAAIQQESTDEKISQIEMTIDRLVGALNKSVEPEVSL